MSKRLPTVVGVTYLLAALIGHARERLGESGASARSTAGANDQAFHSFAGPHRSAIEGSTGCPDDPALASVSVRWRS